MRDNWLFFMDPDGGSSGTFPMDPLVPHGIGGHLLYNISSYIDNSRYLYVSGSLALQEAFNCVSKFAGALLLWFASGSHSNNSREIPGNHIGSNPSSCTSRIQAKRVAPGIYNFLGSSGKLRSKGKAIPVIFGKLSSFTLNQLFKEAERLQSLPALSLAAALIPPLNNITSNVLAVPLEPDSLETNKSMNQRPCDVGNRQCGPCSDISFQSLAWSRNAVESRTGIEFPILLDHILTEDNISSFTPEVLVGTGSRTVTIIRVKSLKLYAFGFYVHPFDVCEKLGPKYASILDNELNKRQDFYQDLLREDINMTVRLVVSCNGIKINTVRDAFEKSLRARLVKTNPNADHRCLQTFGSLFSQDIPLHVGTTINFRRTADGHLITEIGGCQIGSVHSKDLCRAFFDMYIGDIPVCEQTKEEIGKNVASIIRTC